MVYIALLSTEGIRTRRTCFKKFTKNCFCFQASQSRDISAIENLAEISTVGDDISDDSDSDFVQISNGVQSKIWDYLEKASAGNITYQEQSVRQMAYIQPQ